jgi:hopanoid biosynthesis associated RND transporter like protein HpnN
MSDADNVPETITRRFLVALVSRVCDHPRLILGLSLALCALSVVAAATRLEYHTSRNDLISARKDYQQRWKKYLDEFGDDDDIVVVVQGREHDRMKKALDAIAARLGEQPELFDRIFYKVDLRPLHGRALLLAPLAQVKTIQQDYLGDMQRLLDFGPLSWHTLGLHSIVQEAQSRLEGLRPDHPSASDERFLKQLVGIASAAKASLRGERYAAPWGSLLGEGQQKDFLAEPQYFFSGDGEVAFLLVRPVKEASSFTAALKSVSAARHIIAEARDDYPGLRLGLTGMPVLETDEMVAAEHDTRLASWLAIGCVTLLFLVVYRSVYYPLLTVATLLVGTAWALGWLTVTVGHLNILSATFAVMLIGMGDYGVLWVMRYEHARRKGMAVREALLHTTTHVAIGNLTAASTLALAFFAAIFADFKAVAELGWIAGCGVLLCAFACFTVLPSLLMLFDRRKADCRLQVADCRLPEEPEPVILRFPASSSSADNLQSATCNLQSDRWLPSVARRPGLVMAAGLVLALLLGACATRVRYDHNLLHLQAQGLESVQWETTLIEHTSGASVHAVSYRPTRQEALELAERYRRLPQVSQVIEVASLVPPDQDEKLPLVADVHRRLAKLPPRGKAIPHAQPDIVALRADLGALLHALRPLARQAGPQGKLLRDLNRALVELGREMLRTPAELSARHLQQFDQRLAEDLAESLHRLRDVACAAPIAPDELPAALRERYVGKSDTWLLRVFARDDLWDFEPLEQFTRTIQEVDAEASGKPFGTVEGLKAMKNGLERAGLYAFAVIVLVLWLDFRRLGSTLLALTPLVLGVVLSVGVLGLLGLPLNPANMIAFPLILGVGVDNGVHVLHDHLLRRREGRDGVSRAIGRGVLVKALTTMIGFGTLMISTERGLAGLGFILALGVGCSMLSALVLLPASLELLSRWGAARRREPAEPVAAAVSRAA